MSNDAKDTAVPPQSETPAPTPATKEQSPEVTTESTPVPVSPQRLPRITILSVAASMFLFVVLVGFLYWFSGLAWQQATTEEKTPEQKLAELQAEGKKNLNTYDWVDQKKGVVRIPIERAMKLLAREEKQRDNPAGTSTEKEQPAEGQSRQRSPES